MRCKRMTQGMTGGRFLDRGDSNGLADAALHRILVQVMTTPGAGARISGRSIGREYVLPAEVEVRARILPLQRARQLHPAVTEKQARQRLVLGHRRDVSIGRQVRQKRRDLRTTHVARSDNCSGELGWPDAPGQAAVVRHGVILHPCGLTSLAV